MKQYLLNIYQPAGGLPPPEFLARVRKDVQAMLEETKAAGVWVFNGALAEPGSSTVVRVRDGEVVLTDGPFAEAKEFIGGAMVIRAPDLDAALAWGSKLSRATTLPIEVRPFRDPG